MAPTTLVPELDDAGGEGGAGCAEYGRAADGGRACGSGDGFWLRFRLSACEVLLLPISCGSTAVRMLPSRSNAASSSAARQRMYYLGKKHYSLHNHRPPTVGTTDCRTAMTDVTIASAIAERLSNPRLLRHAFRARCHAVSSSAPSAADVATVRRIEPWCPLMTSYILAAADRWARL